MCIYSIYIYTHILCIYIYIYYIIYVYIYMHMSSYLSDGEKFGAAAKNSHVLQSGSKSNSSYDLGTPSQHPKLCPKREETRHDST